MSGPLGSWRDGATRNAIVEFVERVTTESGPEYVPPLERRRRARVRLHRRRREALERARTDDWTAISMKDECACVFADITA